MAEVRGEAEGDVRSQATDHPERTKPDHLHSSQGPLSSIRAAIKRTRTTSQSDPTRERRRPEITIVSAEPLASNDWFSGTSGLFPRPLQSGWSPGLQAVPQVIQEKTQEEHIFKPTAAPRRTTCTSSSATQTEPVRKETSSAVAKSAGKRSTGKKPQKPPRPSLPKPVHRESLPESVTPADEKTGINTVVSTITEDQSESDVKQPNEAHTCSRSVTVHWDNRTAHFSANAGTASHSDSELTKRPVPLPRTKPRKQEVKVQTLVKISEHCDNIHSDAEVFSSNKYLKELLEVFAECEESCDIDNQSVEEIQGEDAGSEMNNNHSQRNIRARIQAFETPSEEGNEPAKPSPLPRRASTKPPVAAKPSVALKPQLSHSEPLVNGYQNQSTIPQIPTPSPRPQPPKTPADLALKEELETLLSKSTLKSSRPSVLTRANSFFEEDYPKVPPTPPVKPFKEPLKPNLNINNHNSAALVTENVYVDTPTNRPVRPQSTVDSNGGSFAKPSVTRRPTTIRVPSKTGSLSDNFQDSPPPLPAQKPVGSLNTSVNHRQSQPPLLRQGSLHVGPDPSLPPRRLTSSKTLPTRPPPAKIGPGRPPPPSLQTTGRSHSASLEASPKPQAQTPQRKGAVLPPRPNPGHRLYNKYTLELPHGVADTDYNGSNTGELSFQKNEVLLLVEEIDHNTFECQVGGTKGRVHKSCMKVITPLSSVSHTSQPQAASPAVPGGAGYELKVQAKHDFTPEGPGELGLRSGDVVTNVEMVDNDWYRGTCRGSTGFFPANYVNILSNSPKPQPERKARPPSATVSGPRCVARFDFEGESGQELSFSEGDVIQLKAYLGEEWARGQVGITTGVFPLNFVEVVEDLPPPPSQQKRQSIRIALPGMAASPSKQLEVAKPAQVSQPGEEWVVALYDFDGKTEGELSFQLGDSILISWHVDAEWSCGRVNGREGMFPRAFAESSSGPQSSNNQQSGASRARALFNFASDCDEELSLQAGDIITGLESVDDEWFLGDLRGKRALVPKNYLQVLG
ncbi:SH3 domain-containing protein 19 isoform X2 [Notothenia coriiceps]|uniref:SH3 domain-containing protein 19 isoform X2 n=1 Tax=Notothenia coriiceps TaxID=8208 RepID=A0A6I9N798_9TELE|nr:PREDICTED: SH3 domain-containing protein 19 isoform X2 [Notothenia coriiceps]